MKKFICRECGYIGRKKSIKEGSILIELILLLTAIIPGVFYQLWRNSSKREVCPQCNSQNMVPINSPGGKKVMEEFNFVADISASKSDREMKTSREKEVTANENGNNVKLVLITVGKEKISVIKEIRTITGMGLKEAKDLSENVPSVIKESINTIEGKQIVERFKNLGAHAELQ